MEVVVPLAAIRRLTLLILCLFLLKVSLPCTGISPEEYYLKHPWANIPPSGYTSGTHTLDFHCGDVVIPQTEPSVPVLPMSLASVSPMSQTSVHCILEIQASPAPPLPRDFLEGLLTICEMRWESSPHPSHGLWRKALTTLSKVNLSFISIFLYSSALVLK